jgi:type VI secretion system secreted protein Hcp
MALPFYVTIEGSRTGPFQGESTKRGQEGKLEGLAFRYGVDVPRDASGLPTGRRQHEPVIMTKQWGAASPQIFQALVTNEVLERVLFEFYRSSRAGAEELFHTILLTGATVAGIEQHVEPTFEPDHMRTPELEEISFTFGRIQIENRAGGRAADDWQR